MKVVGYSDRLSAHAGDRVRFMVSADGAYRADLVRLIHGDDNPAGPGFKAQEVAARGAGEYRAELRRIATGSYMLVTDDGRLRGEHGLRIEGFLYPTTPARGPQGIVSRRSPQGGWSLSIAADGDLEWWVCADDGETAVVATGAPLRAREWYRFRVEHDPHAGTTVVEQEPVVRRPGDPSRATVTARSSIAPGTAGGAALVAALTRDEAGAPTGRLNGKVADLAISVSPGDGEQLRLAASWDLSAGVAGDDARDVSGNSLHGKLVNLPARAVTGPAWTGRDDDFRTAPREYNAVHFHEDDLEDASWPVSFSFELPRELESGVYAARLATEDAEDYVPFFVVPAGRSGNDVAFLASTFTYLAYANEHVSTEPEVVRILGRVIESGHPNDRYIVEHGLSSIYDRHVDGSGVFYASARRPLVTMRPRYNMPTIEYGRGAPHGFNADLHLVDWLVERGVAFDVVTDHDVHAHGVELLDRYRVVLTGTHPEYVSECELDAVEQYVGRGGRLMYLGGNGFECVCSLDAERPHIVEIRRGLSGSPTWNNLPGESRHSTTGEPGGFWRQRGRAPHRLVGVGTTAHSWAGGRGYRLNWDLPEALTTIFFAGVDRSTERVGEFGLVLGGASSMEVDAVDDRFGTPFDAIVLGSADGFPDDYEVLELERQAAWAYEGPERPSVRSDLVYLDMPDGGKVFSVGSIGWCGALSANDYDNDISRITWNVLQHFATAHGPSRLS